MAAPLIVRLVMDAAGYLKTVDTAVASNTKLEQSSLGVGEAMQVSANKSVNASLRATEALKTQIAGYRELAASAEQSAAVRERAALLANRAEARLTSQLGISAALGGTSKTAQTAERDIGKFTRGALAGSGAAVGLGRSLAFASGGFLAFATASTLVRDSILGAEGLAKAQDSLAVAIEKTGGNLAKLQPRYAATAAVAQRFGIDQADATTELARATVLTGDAAKAQRAYREALVISKATGKDFNAVQIATAKGQEGITTSLKRYGIQIATGTSGQKQYQDVFARFAGQANANTTAGEKFTAALHNSEAVIGKALLPAFTRLTTAAADWLTKMNRSGRLEHDVAAGMKLIHTALSPLIAGFRDLAGAVNAFNSAQQTIRGLPGGGILAANVRNAFNLFKAGQPIFQLQDLFGHSSPPPPPPPHYLQNLRQSGGVPPFLQLGGALGSQISHPAVAASGPFGRATPLSVYTQYTQTISEQLAVAQAALTKSTKDDVAAAKRIIARIKRLIAAGHLQGASLVQALQDEASQQGVLNSARQQAAAQAARIAAAKKAAASSYTTPIDLQLAEARAQLTKSTADDIQVEKKILAAARAALNSGKKNKQGQLAALQVMLQAQQAIQSFASQTNTTFTLPLRLQLQLAKAQALGTDQTQILLRMKAALEKALKAAKGNIQKQIDIWNQIAAINQQLDSGSGGTGVLGNFKQASTAALTAGLALSAADRKKLRARLSQLGPGGTVPGSGVGAAGFIIGPDGRPIQVHQHRRPHHGRNADGSGAGSGKPPVVNANIDLKVYIDGKQVEATVTKRQQKRKSRNPSQRRGPNAATH